MIQQPVHLLMNHLKKNLNQMRLKADDQQRPQQVQQQPQLFKLINNLQIETSRGNEHNERKANLVLAKSRSHLRYEIVQVQQPITKYISVQKYGMNYTKYQFFYLTKNNLIHLVTVQIYVMSQNYYGAMLIFMVSYLKAKILNMKISYIKSLHLNYLLILIFILCMASQDQILQIRL